MTDPNRSGELPSAPPPVQTRGERIRARLNESALGPGQVGLTTEQELMDAAAGELDNAVKDFLAAKPKPGGQSGSGEGPPPPPQPAP